MPAPLEVDFDDSDPQAGIFVSGEWTKKHSAAHSAVAGRINSHQTHIEAIEDAIPAGGGTDNVLMRIGASGGSWLDGGKIGWRSISQVPPPGSSWKKKVLTATSATTFTWKVVPIGNQELPASTDGSGTSDDTTGLWLQSDGSQASWEALPTVSEVPPVTGGGSAVGDVLTILEVLGVRYYDWAPAADGLPSGGADGEVLTIVSGVPAWASGGGGSGGGVPDTAGEADGKILTIVSGDAAWDFATTEMPVATASGQTIYFDGFDWVAGRTLTTSTSAPSGTPADGDVWRVREA